MPVGWEKIAAALLPKLIGAFANQMSKKEWDAAWQRVYDRWRDSFQVPEAGEEKLNAAFEDFFSRKPVLDELQKVGRDQYQHIDLDILSDQLQESFSWAGLPPPNGNIPAEIERWFRDLKEMLEADPAFRREHQIPVQSAIRAATRSEAPAGPHSLARKKYVESVIRQHRYIRFSGMADVSGPVEVEIARVFVMPRVVRSTTNNQGPIPAFRLLVGRNAAQRAVILGGPGSGKTTLLEAFSLGLAQPEKFEWSRDFPALLPVFLRVRDLDRSLAQNGGTIWDCLARHCSQRMGETLPAGFFHDEMQASGLAVLFDGLDEAASPARRNHIVDLISEFTETLSKNSRVILSSRPHDYRHRFDSDTYRHYDLQPFDDGEIVRFIQGWQDIHEPDRKAACEKGERLWKALEGRKEILALARNALLLTMIVRVHFGLGQLPESRRGLYEKCAETLLKHWADAKDLGPGPIDYTQKHKLLQRLAWEMQGEAEEWSDDMSLQISRRDLARHFERMLKEDGEPNALQKVDSVIERLHARDAVLVQYGTDTRGQDQFGFVHRSFQEYFAACWMAQELTASEFSERLAENRPGWNETLYLAVASLPDRRRRKTLLDLLRAGRPGFAMDCLRAAPPEQPWLALLVRFLSRYTWEGVEHLKLPVSECADACAERPELWDLLPAIFERENREGQTLAAAVDLAEELARRGENQAAALLDKFFSEAPKEQDEMVDVAAGPFAFGDDGRMVDVPAFFIARYPVTNEEFERMIPRHARDSVSDQDRQPVVHVSWFEARLYCRWRGRGWRLPTEFEWEKAAGWDPKMERKGVYPWGDTFDAARCNTLETGLRKTTVVGSYPAGRSAYGCEDMAGNVWEWTDSLWSANDDARVVRGGSWISSHEGAACAYRTSTTRRTVTSTSGFVAPGRDRLPSSLFSFTLFSHSVL